MGCCNSKSEEDEVEPAYQVKNMYYDLNGNIRCGHLSNDKDSELRQVTLGDAQAMKLMEEDGSEWMVVDSNWFKCWLSFVHLDRGVCPNPGPCRNDRLITYDYKTKKWIARSSLVASTKSASGNYSLVSPAVWEVFKEHYRGSGPEIKYCYQQEHHYHQQQHNDHNKHVVFTDDDEDDENVGYPPHYWDIRQDQCNYEDLVIRQDVEDVVDKEKSDIVVDQEHKRSHHDHEYKHNNYYEQHEDEKSTTSCTHSSITNDIDLVLDSGDDDINNNKNNKKRSHHHHKQHKTYEKMFDRTITKEDRSNILSFFGTRGENLDFHIRSNEKINEKYLHGLGTPEEKQDEDSEVTIKPDVWLFGESNHDL